MTLTRAVTASTDEAPLRVGEAACMLCGRWMAPWLTAPRDWRRPEAGPFAALWCAGCRFGAIHPRPTPEEAAAAYDLDAYYTHSTTSWSPAAEPPATLRDRARIAVAWRADRSVVLTPDELLRWIPAGGRVCDVGCGSGKLLGLARARGLEVVGVEPDPAAREAAASRGLRVVAGSAEALPDELERGSFDGVVMAHSLEHCLDPLAALAGARSLLRPGGALVVEVPNNEALGLARAGAAWPWADVPRHVNFFTASSLQIACRRAGLLVDGVHFTGYCRQFLNSWLAQQQRIARALGVTAPRAGWSLLLRTLLARPAAKYDSVRVTARLP